MMKLCRSVRCLLLSVAALMLFAAYPAASEQPAVPPAGEASKPGTILLASNGHNLSVSRMRLYFSNNRPEITVKRNESISAYAELILSGSGSLSGYWDIDGRIMSHIDQHIAGVGSIVLESGLQPAIPTFEPGTHRLRLVITEPGGISAVEGIYFVTADEADAPKTIHIVTPLHKARIDITGDVFKWEAYRKANSYTVEFFRKPGGKMLFSARVRSEEYRIPENAARKYFAGSRVYYWKVKALDERGFLLGESQWRSFTAGASR